MLWWPGKYSATFCHSNRISLGKRMWLQFIPILWAQILIMAGWVSAFLKEFCDSAKVVIIHSKEYVAKETIIPLEKDLAKYGCKPDMKYYISLTILGKTQYRNLAFFLSFPLLAWGDWTAPTAAIQSCISLHIERNFGCFVQASFRGIHESSKVTRSCHNFIKLQRNMGVHCRANRWSCCGCLGLQLDTTPRARTLQAADQTVKELQEVSS